ncbi:class I SAM-dependent methyltransferase [bacterium]|nr:MAG: class I SAM-dependent methyltransferase [bacterium]
MNKIISPYDRIANEYYDEIHITSRNFDDSQKLGFKGFENIIPKEGSVLEVGAGKGRTIEYLSIESKRIIQLDSSKLMLELTPREESLLRIHADAIDMPFMDNTFNLVTSFLCDPFLGLEFLSEAYRVLRKEGMLLFTTPSYSWGKALRDKIGIEINETRFINKENNIVKVPSILIKTEQIIEMIEHVGFLGNSIKQKILTLPKNIEKISKDIVASSESQKKPPYDIELIHLFYANK